MAAYHIAYSLDDYLYVSGPTTSSFDSIHRISPTGEVEKFFTGLGRPQGIAFDIEGNLYVAASFRGRRGILRFTSARRTPELFVSGSGLVGLAFDYSENMGHRGRFFGVQSPRRNHGTAASIAASLVACTANIGIRVRARRHWILQPAVQVAWAEIRPPLDPRRSVMATLPHRPLNSSVLATRLFQC